MSEKKLTKNETLKENSNFLRGTIKEELKEDSTKFNSENSDLLKFHGIYQQDDRDLRKDLIAEGKDKAYSLMIRARIPGGKLNADQYLRLNKISDEYTNKTIRLTTRQTIQYHGVLKKNIKATVAKINDELINTYGACGDVVRNVMAPPIADIDPSYDSELLDIANQISNYFLPESKGYYEIWLTNEDEELRVDKPEIEPIYGKTYLPRKFKIGIGVEDDNSTDIFTQDIGIVAIKSKDPNKKYAGYNIYIGGGLGHSHNKPETYPRLASPICFTEATNILDICEKVVTIQRDFGGRENRKHARMKYLIDDNGLEWFKTELEKRLGYKLNSPMEIKEFSSKDYLGWHKQKDGNWYLGIFVECGRLKDEGNIRTKSGIKKIVEEFSPGIRFTPQQNIILTDIKELDKSKIEQIVCEHGFYITNKSLSTLRRNSIACVSMPTCGLAIAEAERKLPFLISELEDSGYGTEEITIRISGCPNSCSRAPVSEIGLIGVSLDMYNLYLGGEFNGTRLNKIYKEKVSGKDLKEEICILIDKYRTEKNKNERFGDYCFRTIFK